ncbi:MAG: carboxypeptidase-like regulatory domain-containing protein [Microscillaceae bacterium]|jgi:hypothetical protein|nr:carboxypeptidase-like regulatory domain-containing protein [Microscillaceae bacterium]
MGQNQEKTILINGETHKIPQDLTALQEILAKQGENSFQIGEKIYNIGEIGQAEFSNIIHQHYQESRSSQWLKIFLYFLVPLLSISLSVVLYRSWVQSQPLTLTVKLQNLTPNKDLPLEKAKISLVYGDKTEAQDAVNQEVTFKGLPASLSGQKVILRFESQGFVSLDTQVVLSKNVLMLAVKRDNSLGKVFGLVKDTNGKPLAGVKITIQDDLSTLSNEEGRFSLPIPFAKQRKEQTIRAFKAGYQLYTRLEPIIENEETLIVLDK